jgi:hypothetical protein
LGESREEHSRALFVFCETGAQFLTEKQFFTAGLDVKGKPCDHHREQGPEFTESGGQQREQNPGLHRMTSGAVGPGSNQFVAFFEGDHTTPIRAKMPACPKGHRNSTGCPGNAQPLADWPDPEKTIAQPAIKRMGLIEEVKTQPGAEACMQNVAGWSRAVWFSFS